MAGAGASASALALQWPLVGRHEEVELFAATLEDEAAHGFVIHGAAGVGKTRLAEQCLDVARRLGRSVARATATEGSSSVPLGVLAHLLPPDLTAKRGDLLTLMAEIRPVLEQSEGGALVLLVDDLDLVDVTSATLLTQLVDAGVVFLLATVRDGTTVPAGLDGLWRRGWARRVDLGDLDRIAVDSLLHLVLRDPIDLDTSAQLYAASRGNVLFLRELVLGALERGQLHHRRGVWRLHGELATTRRLQELVDDRLCAVDPAATEALHLLAIWQPIGVTTIEEIVGHEPLELLDRAGLLELRTEGRRQELRFGHPLYAEVVRARMPALTRRRLLLALAEHIEARGGRRREDPIRIAIARLDATGTADPELLLQAARLARYGHDFVQVERFARAAVAQKPTAEGGLLLGEALHELGQWVEADEVLEAAARDTSAPGQDVFTHLVEMRSRNLMWGLFRDEEALAVNRAALDRLREPDCLEELALNEAMLLTHIGRPRDALSLIESLGEPTRPRARALRSFAELPALAATGRCVTAADEAATAFEVMSGLSERVAMPGEGVHLITRIYALSEAGRFADAAALAEAVYDATPADAPPDALMWLAFGRGRCALLRGLPATARRWFTDALVRSEDNHHAGPRRLVLSRLAVACALLGDTAGATAAADELERIAPFAFQRPEQELGRAWALVATGDLPGARELLLTAAELAAAAGYRTAEAALLHDVARLGSPAAVTSRLTELARICEGRLVVAFAAHATAAAHNRPHELLDATTRFETIGATLLAAEAAAAAAQALQQRGERRAATQASARSAALAAACEGARTPLLNTPVMLVPLTSRERDIATLAARGLASQAIADRLYLSVRTVNNHLQSVYSKLGVSGRHELPDALGRLDTTEQQGVAAER